MNAKALATEIAAVIDVHVRAVVGPLERRIAALEKANAQKGLRYRGVWQAAESYGCGDFVTRDGSMWHANAATRDVPGTTRAWALAVKAGR